MFLTMRFRLIGAILQVIDLNKYENKYLKNNFEDQRFDMKTAFNRGRGIMDKNDVKQNLTFFI